MKPLLIYILCSLYLYTAVAQTVTYPPRLIVAQDGSGNYNTIQEALNAIPLNNIKPVTLFIKNGIYKEKLLLDSSKNFVTLIGEDKFKTILTYDDHTGKISPNGDSIITRTSWSCKILANNFTASKDRKSVV